MARGLVYDGRGELVQVAGALRERSCMSPTTHPESTMCMNVIVRSPERESAWDGCSLLSDDATFEDETWDLSPEGRDELVRRLTPLVTTGTEVEVELSSGEHLTVVEAVSPDTMLDLVRCNRVRNATRYRVRVRQQTSD